MLTGDMNEVGYYEQAQKVVKAALTVIAALQLVMNSRIANAHANGDKKEVKECLEKSFNFVWFLAIPMMFGLIAVAPKFVPWFYGDGFERVTPILIVTAPILVVIGLNGVTGIQYLVQIGKQNILTLSVIIGAISNIILNLILIHFFDGVGAAIASVCAELIILLIQLKYFKEVFSILKVFKLSFKCLIGGIIMFVVVYMLANHMAVSITNTAIQIIIGGVVYIVVLLLMRYKFLIDLYMQVLEGIKTKVKEIKGVRN